MTKCLFTSHEWITIDRVPMTEEQVSVYIIFNFFSQETQIET